MKRIVAHLLWLFIHCIGVGACIVLLGQHESWTYIFVGVTAFVINVLMVAWHAEGLRSTLERYLWDRP